MARIGPHQPDDVFERHALPRAAPPEQAERGPFRNNHVQVVKDPPAVKGLADMFETDRRFARHTRTGKSRKISFTRTTFTRMMQMDDSTTLLVDARPTPSV